MLTVRPHTRIRDKVGEVTVRPHTRITPSVINRGKMPILFPLMLEEIKKERLPHTGLLPLR